MQKKLENLDMFCFLKTIVLVSDYLSSKAILRGHLYQSPTNQAVNAYFVLYKFAQPCELKII